jgi:PAS domain-containing protein
MTKFRGETHPKTVHAEQEFATLVAREERMRLALAAGRIHTWDWDIAADLIVWSSGLEKELLIARAPGNVAAFQALVHPDDADFVAARLQAAIEGPDDYDAEFRMVRGDGSVRWCSARAIVVRNNAGRAVRMVGVDQDVTEKHELLQRTTDSEARLRTVYESLAAEAASRIGSWDSDIATDRVYVSDSYGSSATFRVPQSCRFTGYSTNAVTEPRSQA